MPAAARTMLAELFAAGPHSAGFTTRATLSVLVHATTRPYAIGDVVDLGVHSGQVIDVGLCTTKLLEMDAARQYTGHTLDVPNALLVTASVRNLSHTGRYVIESLRGRRRRDAHQRSPGAKRNGMSAYCFCAHR